MDKPTSKQPAQAPKVNAKHQAATKIQAFWRGRKVRGQYAISQLPVTALKDYQAFLVGNMPYVPDLADIALARAGEKIALVGNSGLRSLELILSLSVGSDTPKLVIVENSRQVVCLWRRIRKMACEFQVKSSVNMSAEKQFLQAFNGFRKNPEILALYRHLSVDVMQPYTKKDVYYYKQDVIAFMNMLIEAHGLDRVLSVIKHSTILAQSWTDNTLFPKLKNILQKNNVNYIVAFPSNVAAYIAYKNKGASAEAESVFDSLEALEPALTIIADLCARKVVPGKVTITDKKLAQEIKGEMGWHALCDSYKPKPPQEKIPCAVM